MVGGIVLFDVYSTNSGKVARVNSVGELPCVVQIAKRDTKAWSVCGVVGVDFGFSLGGDYSQVMPADREALAWIKEMYNI